MTDMQSRNFIQSRNFGTEFKRIRDANEISRHYLFNFCSEYPKSVSSFNNWLHSVEYHKKESSRDERRALWKALRVALYSKHDKYKKLNNIVEKIDHSSFSRLQVSLALGRANNYISRTIYGRTNFDVDELSLKVCEFMGGDKSTQEEKNQINFKPEVVVHDIENKLNQSTDDKVKKIQEYKRLALEISDLADILGFESKDQKNEYIKNIIGELNIYNAN